MMFSLTTIFRKIDFMSNLQLTRWINWTKTLKNQNLCVAQSVSTSAILNATLIFRLFSHLDLLLCINSIFFRGINVNAILISNNEFYFLLPDFTQQIYVDFMLNHKISQFLHVLDVISKTISFFCARFINKKNCQNNRLTFNNDMTQCCKFLSRWNCDDKMLFKDLLIRRWFLNFKHVFGTKIIVCFYNRRCDFVSICWCSVWNSTNIDYDNAKNTFANKTRHQCD